MDATPVGMEDVTGYPALFAELARRGYGQADLEKIASGNMLRVLTAVEAYAKVHAGDPPIETPVATKAEDWLPYPRPCCTNGNPSARVRNSGMLGKVVSLSVDLRGGRINKTRRATDDSS